MRNSCAGALALLLAACGGGSSLPGSTSSPPVQAQSTTPTNVTATPWPHTALVAFDPPTATAGRTIVNYVVEGTTASFVTGAGAFSPIMVQGVNGVWDPGSAYAFQVVANYSDGTSSAASPASLAVQQTGGAGASTSPNVYVAGMFYWQGDFSFNGSVSYADSTGEPATGPYDVMWTSSGTGGGWQPYAPDNGFDLTPYNFLQLDLKPTTSAKTWTVSFEKVGNVPVNAQVTLPSDSNGTYGPAPVVGQWTSYKIPLQVLNVGPQTSNPVILKFSLADGAPTAVNSWYVTNVRFTEQ